MWKLFKKTKPMLGLEMTGTSIKILELQQQEQQYCIERCALESINSSTEQARAAALQIVIEKVGIDGREVAITVSGPTVFTRLLQIEKGLKETEIQEQIELGLETWFPFPIEEVFYDFTIMNGHPNDAKMQTLYVAVAERKLVQSKLDWIESFGLKVAAVEVASLSLERAFRLFLASSDSLPSQLMKTHLLLDIGERNTMLYLVRDYRFITAQEMGSGFSQHLEEWTVFKERLAENIHRALQLFLSEQGSKSASSLGSLVISGEFPQALELEITLQGKLGMEVFLANPFSKRVFSSTVNFPLLSQEAHRWLSILGIAAWPFDHG